jgi:hypothetical protein
MVEALREIQEWQQQKQELEEEVGGKKSLDNINYDGYCMKCKENIIIKNPERIINKRGNPMIKGTCPKCNTVVCNFKV